MDTITTALGNAFTTVSSNAMSAIEAGVPAALTIVGAVIVVNVAVKAFKSIAAK